MALSHMCLRLLNSYSSKVRSSSLRSYNYGKHFFSSEKVNPEASSSGTEAGPLPPEVNADQAATTAKLEDDNKMLVEQIKTIDDKYKRALAENENIRQRMRKQIEEAKRFSIQGFCKDLTEVADILGTAMEVVPKEQLVDSNPHLKNLHQGLSMTEAQLQAVFKRHGLTKLNPIGEKFDPNVHEALFELDSDKEPGTIAAVTKIGYRLHERTIRPAMVGVAKRKT